MPLIDGVRALHRLREASSFRDLPVIILTGTDNPATRCELAHLGIFRFLKKQPNFANVISALDDFISFYNHKTTASVTLRLRDRGSRSNLKSSRLGYFQPRRSRG
jgi:CheY-like chemotaxis protein